MNRFEELLIVIPLRPGPNSPPYPSAHWNPTSLCIAATYDAQLYDYLITVIQTCSTLKGAVPMPPAPAK
jgi:hypothetical protein